MIYNDFDGSFTNGFDSPGIDERMQPSRLQLGANQSGGINQAMSNEFSTAPPAIYQPDWTQTGAGIGMGDIGGYGINSVDAAGQYHVQPNIQSGPVNSAGHPQDDLQIFGPTATEGNDLIDFGFDFDIRALLSPNFRRTLARPPVVVSRGTQVSIIQLC